VYTLKGQGIPRLDGRGRGSLIAVMQVDVPMTLSPRARELLVALDGELRASTPAAAAAGAATASTSTTDGAAPSGANGAHSGTRANGAHATNGAPCGQVHGHSTGDAAHAAGAPPPPPEPVPSSGCSSRKRGAANQK
jgi:hypothetical protein